MRFYGLSPVTVALLGAGIAATLLVLHLLRVRLRQVEVDTLLFFKLAGVVQKPRVLPGRPARWLSLLLALLAAAAALFMIADLRPAPDRASRLVVVEPGPGPVLTERLQAAAAIVDVDGLGPRGGVVLGAPGTPVLLASDEPAAVLPVRSAALPAAGSELATMAAVRAAADRLRPGDELVFVGAVLPESPGELPLQPRWRGRAVEVQPMALRWSRLDRQQCQLLVQVLAAADGTAELRLGEQVLATAPVHAGRGGVELGPVALPATTTQLVLHCGGASQTFAVPPPSSTPLRVGIAADLAADLAAAVTAVLAIDPECVLVDGGAGAAEAAELIVAGSDASDDPRPRLVLSPGVGAGRRQPLLAAGCPVGLSLRDRQRRDAPALALPAGAKVANWIDDAAQAAVLAAATVEGSRQRVHIVDWLLEPLSHADVPLLLATALHQLGGRPGMRIAVEGQPLALPMGLPGVVTSDGVVAMPQHGAASIAFGTAGVRAVQLPSGPVTVHVLPVTAAVPAEVAANESTLASFGGSGALAPWLLTLLVAVLLLDAWLFHRGRLP